MIPQWSLLCSPVLPSNSECSPSDSQLLPVTPSHSQCLPSNSDCFPSDSQLLPVASQCSPRASQSPPDWSHLWFWVAGVGGRGGRDTLKITGGGGGEGGLARGPIPAKKSPGGHVTPGGLGGQERHRDPVATAGGGNGGDPGGTPGGHTGLGSGEGLGGTKGVQGTGGSTVGH